jgi:hypothetical protein
MNYYAVKRLALILAIQAEIDGMKALNLSLTSAGDSTLYTEQDFIRKAQELRDLASMHDFQL